jgi:hypothetical protein
MPGLARNQRLEIAVQAAIGVIASLLLFWGLTEKYLWQDEAATAILGRNMLKFGRPLAYDGVNLVTIDVFTIEDKGTIGQRTKSAQAVLDYEIHRGDIKPDTAWKFHPWGQYVVAALGIAALGQTTLGARLPFALAALAAVLVLFRMVRRYCDSLAMAALAALLLTCNVFWILHARQCRYYSLSSLLLLLTMLAWVRWQWEGRSPAWFVVAAWGWFQFDFGTVWPVCAVLFLAALIGRRRSLRQTVAAGIALAAAVAPFIAYYQLWVRQPVQLKPWKERFRDNLFNMNEYTIPALLVLAAVALLVLRWKSVAPAERSLAAVSCAVVLAMMVWIPTVAAAPFLRYAIIVEPACALLAAWVLVRWCGSRAPWLVWVGMAMLILTPWLSVPLRAVNPPPEWAQRSIGLRWELPVFYSEVLGRRPDPNRIVVEWLRHNAAPTDEILINYEDLPLEFYLPNPIRGGVAAFRAEDDSQVPPRFVIMRHAVDFVHWPVFEREIARYQWAPVTLQAPDVKFGNNPDPLGEQVDPAEAHDLYLARRIGP